MKRIVWIAVAVTALAACTESPQKLQTSSRDTPAYSGTGKAFANQDWKQGDKANWESHLKARSQYGMNDYTRMN